VSRRSIAFWLAIILGSIAWSGCGGGGGSSGGSSGASSPQVIKIGWAGPLTGDQAYFGRTWLNGVKLAAQEFRLTGRLKGSKVELMPLDDGADPQQGVTVAQRHVSAGVKGVIANFNSGVTLATKPIYGRAQIPQVTNSSNPDITQENPLRTLIRPIANDNAQGGAMADFMAGKGIERVAVLDDSQAFGQGVATTFAERAKERGVQVVARSSLNPNAQDFRGALSDALGKQPQALYFGGTVTQGGLLCRQARAAGFDGPFMGPDGLFDTAFIRGCGTGVGQAYVSFQGPPYDSSPRLKAFAARYRRAFGQDPGPYSVYGYNELGFLLSAMNAAGTTDSGPVADQLHRITYQSILGPQHVDEKGDLIAAPIFIYRVKGTGFALAQRARA
jgi:branched-chain amino acid transport system substrate-binding protein